jgi:hypothetical protein
MARAVAVLRGAGRVRVRRRAHREKARVRLAKAPVLDETLAALGLLRKRREFERLRLLLAHA